MDENAISVSISDDEREFIDSQIAAGRYADDEELLHAGIAALEREQKLQTLRELIAEGGADIARADVISFDSSEEFLEHILNGTGDLRDELEIAEASGTSSRQIPDIMKSVKAKLRANGAL